MKDILKPEYRYDYYKDLKTALLGVSSGIGVGYVAFLATVKPTQFLGLSDFIIIAVLISVIFNLLVWICDYIGSGFFFDAKESKEAGEDKQWEEDYNYAKMWGSLSTNILITELLLTMLWLILMVIVVTANV